MELPHEAPQEKRPSEPRKTGDISPMSIVVCLLILGFAVFNRYCSLQ